MDELYKEYIDLFKKMCKLEAESRGVDKEKIEEYYMKAVIKYLKDICKVYEEKGHLSDVDVMIVENEVFAEMQKGI